jgi:hypothetical protein
MIVHCSLFIEKQGEGRGQQKAEGFYAEVFYLLLATSYREGNHKGLPLLPTFFPTPYTLHPTPHTPNPKSLAPNP